MPVREKTPDINPRRIWRLGLVAILTAAATLSLAHSGYWFTGWPNSPFMRRVAAADETAAKIVAGAKSQIGTEYNAQYVSISYPNGDVPAEYGACTDVVVRSLRAAGHDLQRLIHEDMKRSFGAYPNKWGLDAPNSDIDHRRVPNQARFFERHGQRLTKKVNLSTLSQWQPGDIVYWKTNNASGYHTGVLSDGVNSDGVPLVIHNGWRCVEQDCLTRWPIIGHYRYPVR